MSALSRGIGFVLLMNSAEVVFPASINMVALAVLGGSLVGSLFSSDAWNNVTFTGSEVVNPKRNLPLSLFLGTMAVSLLYLRSRSGKLVPLDVKVTEPVLKRAQAAGIKVITHEGPEQAGRDWNVELIDSIKIGRAHV